MPVLASKFPIISAFGTILFFFLFVVWFWILITVFADLFRRRDIGGGMKVLWMIFVIVLPYLGVFVYLIFEHSGMSDRSVKEQKAAQSQFDQYVQSVATKSDPAAQIANAKQLLDAGTITQAEFDQIKQKALAVN
ncbi:MAG: SHOCT domain-containing protein [Solirubrobacteraceae bacterium]